MSTVEMAQLRTLRAVAETLNFTRAAERLGITQSAVSHQIKALEAELGEPLFVRAKRGVLLAEGGRAALDHAARILDEADALRARLQGEGRAPSGRVRAGAATQAFVHLFAGLFESFMKTHPRIELTFRTTVSTDQTVADILAGGAEVGFAALPVYAPSLQVRELFEDELVLVAGPEHRLAGQRTASVADVAEARLVLFERGSSVRRATDAFFHEVGVRPALALESNDTYFVKLMVEHGLGVSLLPAWAAREEVAQGRLVRLAIEGHRLRRSVSMIFLGRFPPAATRAFVEFMLAHRDELQSVARG
jgi:DNA-binding transcriptional LysR family regulator